MRHPGARISPVSRINWRGHTRNMVRFRNRNHGLVIMLFEMADFLPMGIKRMLDALLSGVWYDYSGVRSLPQALAGFSGG